MQSGDNQMTALELKVGVLRHLRSIVHQSAITQKPDPLDLTWVAFDLRVPVEVVQGAIAELLLLDYVKPLAERNFAITDGECEITKAGMMFLNQVEIVEETRSGPGTGFFDLEG